MQARETESAQAAAAHAALILDELRRPEGSALSAKARTLLEQLGACPNGCQWFRSANGFRCGGGGHTLRRSWLEAEFALSHFAAAPPPAQAEPPRHSANSVAVPQYR